MREFPFALVAAALLSGGCPSSKSSDGDRGSGAPTATTAEPVLASAACDTRDRAECLRALHCTLHHVDESEYACRPAAGRCETNLLQEDRAGCESRAGCSWDPGGCYCPFPGYGRTQVADKAQPSGQACGCGGGPPPRCRAAN